MPEWFLQIPEFWKGFVANILASIFIALSVLLFRTYSKIWKARRMSKERALQVLAEKLNSDDPLLRTEATLTLVFTVLRYFMIANLFWIAPEAFALLLDYTLGPRFGDAGTFVLKLVGLAYISLAVYWVSKYYALKARARDEGTRPSG